MSYVPSRPIATETSEDEIVRNQLPFLVNERLDCGPISLAMAAQYFGLHPALESIRELAVAETAGVTWTLGLAAAAATLGLRAHLCTKSLGANPDNFELEYYKEYAAELSVTQKTLAGLLARCRASGVLLEERSVTRNEICASVRRGEVPIILLDWNTILACQGFLGHFVPVVGFTGETMLVHNPGPLDPTPFMEIPNSLFETARTAPGTDEDILFLNGEASVP